MKIQDLPAYVHAEWLAWMIVPISSIIPVNGISNCVGLRVVKKKCVVK